MKKWLGFSLIFIVCYLAFLLATAPASLILNQVKLPSNVVIQGVSGSIWHAKAKTVYAQNVVIHQVSAKLDWLSLLSFNPRLNVSFGDDLLPGPEGYLTMTMQGGLLHIDNANAMLSADIIAQQLPLPIPMTAQGIVELDIVNYQQGAPLCQALTGQVTWRQAKINALDENVTLGRINGDLRCDQGAIALEIKPDNQLGLSYNAFVGANLKVSGNGYLQPGDNFPAQLRGVLPFLGSPDRQGRYRLRL
ncbi:type II secretion system protein N [Thalassotalea sp. LPB0316]|uniref:type II secretion system protein N n=1 Tax=Thalassotalea sp. LPB0316 TaxID=2769490 RepID=UPI001865D0BD|nr:type II secretion system protein N [Thalassotalea sp. LPB0316]QOL26597.1 type II secretion system protein N [Thalassotalea sp. LPB0316]